MFISSQSNLGGNFAEGWCTSCHLTLLFSTQLVLFCVCSCAQNTKHLTKSFLACVAWLALIGSRQGQAADALLCSARFARLASLGSLRLACFARLASLGSLCLARFARLVLLGSLCLACFAWLASLGLLCSACFARLALLGSPCSARFARLASGSGR